MRIALDALGGDFAPQVVLEAAVEAARTQELEITLVGPEDLLQSLLARYAPLPSSLATLDAPEVVAMDEHPATAVRQKRRSSISLGIDLVKSGSAAAFVSAGNTGAVMAFALLHLGRISGVERPALGTVFPTTTGQCLFLDVGANAECKPSQLLQFAQMGVAYAERVLGMDNVRVALLNIGEEETKGSQLAQEAHKLLKESKINFVGNIEGKDLPKGLAEVVVTDGFSGNLAIKVAEGVAESIMDSLRTTLLSRWHYRLAASLLRPAFRSVARRLDYAEYGGAPLLGVKGVVVIAHGRSNARALQQALRVARQAVEGGLLEAIDRGIERKRPAPTP